jgi:hypothetical protein
MPSIWAASVWTWISHKWNMCSLSYITSCLDDIWTAWIHLGFSNFSVTNKETIYCLCHFHKTGIIKEKKHSGHHSVLSDKTWNRVQPHLFLSQRKAIRNLCYPAELNYEKYNTWLLVVLIPCLKWCEHQNYRKTNITQTY